MYNASHSAQIVQWAPAAATINCNISCYLLNQLILYAVNMQASTRVSACSLLRRSSRCRRCRNCCCCCSFHVLFNSVSFIRRNYKERSSLGTERYPPLYRTAPHRKSAGELDSGAQNVPMEETHRLVNTPDETMQNRQLSHSSFISTQRA